jgi:hypothetical protein
MKRQKTQPTSFQVAIYISTKEKSVWYDEVDNEEACEDYEDDDNFDKIILRRMNNNSTNELLVIQAQSQS